MKTTTWRLLQAWFVSLVPVSAFFVLLAGVPSAAPAVTPEIAQDTARGTLRVSCDGRELFTYQFGKELAIPHYWPLRSPAGRLLTQQHPDPFPHHRSCWIADHVQVADQPAVDFYHCWKNYNVAGDPTSGYRHFVRHDRFDETTVKGRQATIVARLRWMINETTPVIDERRSLIVTTLENGEYLIDLSWELQPSDQPVTFVSDWVHYAWPYLRMHPDFSGESGGTISDDQGRHGQTATDGQVARWIDYSNAVGGQDEGLAIFVYPDGADHKWLTREYGTFGPRRADRFSGTRFTLQAGATLSGRIGILVHKGDMESGRVRDRYLQYIEGTL